MNCRHALVSALRVFKHFVWISSVALFLFLRPLLKSRLGRAPEATFEARRPLETVH